MLIYLLTVNALGLCVMHYDKHLAQNKKWRVPEKTLLWIAAVGGSVGCLLGMYSARHKTKKPKFYVGIPAILLLQVLAILFCYEKLSFL